MDKNRILLHLKDIEEKNDVRILYAVETGSRAWGFASPDSDWDVRFIYVHPIEWYLTVEPQQDFIEVILEDGFDAAGWDIRKALSLFRRTNPSMLEWLHSPISYISRENLREELLRLEPYYFNAKRGVYHYYHVATNHQNRYLEKRGVELKRYLYYLRSLLACKWILERGTPPPVPFTELVNAMVNSSVIQNEISHILNLKSKSKEHDKEIISDVLKRYGQELNNEVADKLGAYKEQRAQGEHDGLLNTLMFKLVRKAMPSDISCY